MQDTNLKVVMFTTVVAGEFGLWVKIEGQDPEFLPVGTAQDGMATIGEEKWSYS
jgi:hypothetical protein